MIITESDINEYVKINYHRIQNGALYYTLNKVVLHNDNSNNASDIINVTLHLTGIAGHSFINTPSLRRSDVIKYIREKKLKGIFND